MKMIRGICLSDIFLVTNTYPVPVHHLHVRPINGRRLMSPTPTIIPITQILNFVILNISYLFSSDKYYYCTQHYFLEVNNL
jgi:hypothetical protein